MHPLVTLSTSLLELIREALPDADVLLGGLPEQLDESAAPVVIAIVPTMPGWQASLTHGDERVGPEEWGWTLHVRCQQGGPAPGDFFVPAGEVWEDIEAAIAGAPDLDSSSGPLHPTGPPTWEGWSGDGIVMQRTYTHARQEP